jgi:hypothetical protein
MFLDTVLLVNVEQVEMMRVGAVMLVGSPAGESPADGITQLPS